MIIRFYGTRGSVPVSGKEFLKYGGDTTCIEIRSDKDDVIVIDAGSGIRRLGNKLLKEKKREINLIFTHPHWDHIQGFPFFKPIYNAETEIHIYGCGTAQKSIRHILSDSMKTPYFPINLAQTKATLDIHKSCDKVLTIGSITITPILLNHPGNGQGYKFEENGKVFVFLTDNELGYCHSDSNETNKYQSFVQEADLLIHDAEFTEKEYASNKGWGHSLFTDALELAINANVTSFGLFHHNQDHDDDCIDGMVSECRQILNSKHIHMNCFAAAMGQEIVL